jgi:hypothetical protein
MNWVKDENYRRELVLRGETFANVFLSYRRNFRDSSTHELEATIDTDTALPPSAPTAITSLSELSEEPTGPTVSPPPETIEYEIHNNDMTMM